MTLYAMQETGWVRTKENHAARDGRATLTCLLVRFFSPSFMHVKATDHAMLFRYVRLGTTGDLKRCSAIRCYVNTDS
jgi:hypothetical protein